MTFADNISFVIGGGPSLKGFDFRRLLGRPCYGANKAAFDCPHGFLISIDRDFCLNFQNEIAAFGNRAFLAPPDNILDRKKMEKLTEANYLSRVRNGDFFNPPPDSMLGLNSGMAALSKALGDGYKRIALLGIDMNTGGGHYHDGYAWGGGQKDGIIGAWIDQFEAVAAGAKDRGIQIVNFSPNSAVKGFERRPLEDIETAFNAAQ